MKYGAVAIIAAWMAAAASGASTAAADDYMVVDLSPGSTAERYHVAHLDAPPDGGWTDEYKTTKLVLRRIAPGSFRMKREYDVTLTRPYYIGVFEVTQKQYELVTGERPSRFVGDALPVESVSWEAIRDTDGVCSWPDSPDVDRSSFMGKLRARTGIDFDLPTEAQWEFACRAGTDMLFYWGDSLDCNYCWYRRNSGGTTHTVGTKTPNAWGIYDMEGNVSEWCLDWYGKRSSGETDPVGPSIGYRRVRRGGGWYFDSWDWHCFEYSDEFVPDRGLLGFRICASSSIVDDVLKCGLAQIPGKDYMVGKHEVTQALWKYVMGFNPSCFKCVCNPVERVSWDDCCEFLRKFNALPKVKKAGLVFRLPTEEEWEYACRAGATGKYCKSADGSEITNATLDDVAWHVGNSGYTTHPVGQKKPNAFGLYDMHGNVREWTETSNGDGRVFRGGCFDYSAEECESSFTNKSWPSSKSDSIGLRLFATKTADKAMTVVDF